MARAGLFGDPKMPCVEKDNLIRALAQALRNEDTYIFAPDMGTNEEFMAWIQLHAGKSCAENEIKDFCKSKLAHFKVPRFIWLVESLPMTVTGKLQKFRMREIAIEKLKNHPN